MLSPVSNRAFVCDSTIGERSKRRDAISVILKVAKRPLGDDQVLGAERSGLCPARDNATKTAIVQAGGGNLLWRPGSWGLMIVFR